MLNSLKPQILYLLKIAIALFPCLASMYLLFYFEKYEVWIPQTAHRDKITILVLIIGLLLSFLLYSRFDKRGK